MYWLGINIMLLLITCVPANLSGPFLLWGHDKLKNFQPHSLIQSSENSLADLFRSSTTILIFIQNNTKRLNLQQYPKLEELIKSKETSWIYLPQQSLVADPFNHNANVKLINEDGSSQEIDADIVTNYLNEVSNSRAGKVLAILGSREENPHFLSKRAVNELEANNQELPPSAVTPVKEVNETEDTFSFVADGEKAVLVVSSAPVLNTTRESFILKEHNKAITFDDQQAKGYGRLNIIFKVGDEKLFVRFNFTLKYGSWSIKAVEIEYRENKNILPVLGNAYSVPSAPLGFSYRCSSRPLVFTNMNDTLTIVDYQIQPWLKGAARFGDVYDCVGFISAPIWAGIAVTSFLSGILFMAILAIMDIKTPSRFENSRSKQLTFATQD